VARDDVATVTEDSIDSVIMVLDNDTDPDPGETLSVTAVGDAGHGAVINNATEVIYTPEADFCGTDTFTYTVSDGHGGFDSATVEVTVTCVNDPPVANDDSATTEEEMLVVIDLVANDTDVDGIVDPASLSVVMPPTHGSLTLAAAGTVSYTPDAEYLGEDVFTYKVDDDEGATSNEASVTVTIEAVAEYLVYLPLVTRAYRSGIKP
jgi:alanine-alpha-ketoisovalerate/valine-pyruvate aminotransferase